MKRHPTRILVAEDDPKDAFLLERAFSKSGAEVSLHFVRDGAEAIEYLDANDPGADGKESLPDLMLLDLKMPRLNGFDVLEWLRKQDSVVGRMPAVMLTSSSEPEDVLRAYELGANSYLVKPNDPAELARLAGVLDTYWSENIGPGNRADVVR
jgi:CheY-like chemotaxis protein